MKKNEFTLSDAVLLTLAIILAISLVLGSNISPLVVDERWLWLAVFVLSMLIQSIFTRFCLVARILKALFPNLK